MARVSRRPPSVLARRATSRIAKRHARKHRVILESVTQEKKKLRSVISFEAKAPPGYTFIPAGNPQLTTACKELCRKDGLKVFAVTTTPHMHTHNLSQHVHRIGYHFPSAAVAAVCMDLGLYLTAAGKAVPFRTVGGENDRKRADSEVSQTTINTEARDVLRDLFPNIPDNDLNQIIKTAFQKGQRKVGTAVELPLARRAQLAVVAHIRHIYTDYDRLLKATSFHEARTAVEEPTLAKLVEWRGDDENGKTVLEDVFREVIVISDDEDSDVEGEPFSPNHRDNSVMVVSSNPQADELQTRTLNYANPALRDTQLDPSDEEAPPGFRYIPEPPRRHKIDRRGFSRYQAWDRALNRYRNIANETNQHRLHDASVSRGPVVTRQPLPGPFGLDSESAHRPRVSLAPVATSSTKPTSINIGRTVADSVMERYELHRMAELPVQRKEIAPVSSAVSMERVPVIQQQKRTYQREDSPNAPVFVSGPREIHEMTGDPAVLPRPLGPSQHRTSVQPQDHALPSIETATPMEIRRPNSGQLDYLAKRISGDFSIRSITPHRSTRQEMIHHDPDISDRDQASKRRRMGQCDRERLCHTQARVITTGATFPYTSGRYQDTSGHTHLKSSSIQDDIHFRRRYAAPVGSHPVAESLPERTQYSTYTTAPGPRTETAVHQRPLEDVHGHASHFVPSRLPIQYRSPGQSQVVPSTRYAIPENNVTDRLVPVRPSELRERRVYHEAPRYNSGSLRPLEVAQLEGPTRRDREYDHPLVSQEPSQGRHYAEDFVRAVDLRDPVPTKYPAQRRLQTANYPVHPHPPPAGIPVQTEQYMRSSPGITEWSKPVGRVCLDSRAGPAIQDYVVADHQGPRNLADRVPNPPFTARHYVRGYEDAVDTSRQAYELPHDGSRMEEQRYPTYVRRVERVPYTVPEGRTVVIVD
ncbi:hypothetical protein CBS76997_603 [Aspergillus niger]|uniref:Chromosome segregation protein Spc25 family protein n=1 Tax=Aspergillus niger TaxID=5061 RepID=A0A3F3RXS6_ASPNG|nr:hypothetical protein CBS13152_6760 [Aspergillus niger]KAI2893914.1 hypothetical protein CBS11852_5095 [Aspergillus niger]KAI3008730.1 hypothetical protein CBS147345_6846 [Aspergillus niger]KAI3052644.1 hypothetical protein CBS76997_603 [Aspergillus niger]TPR01750.1 Chromosome segregation protein Spc25 family protein [Aspergillus niger]